MTVNNSDSVITYHANGSTTQWVFTFPAVDPEFMEVFITDPLGVVIQLDPALYQLIMDPTVDPNPTSQGGKVIYPITGSPLANGNLLTIVRNLPAIQSTSISNQSIVYPPVIEQEFDYLTLLTRAGSDFASRAFRVGFSDPIPALVPPVAERANHSAFFDSFGNLTPGEIPGQGVFISAAMIPVVQAASIALARGLLDVFSKAETIALGFSTGDLKPTHKTVADAGWILWSDGTIGDPTSGSSIRQNADVLNLFTLYYTGYSDANCPLLTSTGAATTRAAQGTATTAFGAHCRLTLPRGAGRSLAISGSGAGLTSRAIGSRIGTETQTPTVPNMAAHAHGSSAGGNFWTDKSFGAFDGTGTQVALELNQLTDTRGGGNPFNIMSPTTYINVMVKL